MSDKPKDRWDKFDIFAKAVSVLLLPVIILIVSQRYTSQQKEIDNDRAEREKIAAEQQHSLDRLQLLLSHLASENARERKLAWQFVDYLDQSNQFPYSLLLALYDALQGDKETAHEAAHALERIIARHPEIAQRIEQDAQSSTDVQNAVENAKRLNPNLKNVLNPAKNKQNQL